jgi:hypothetical protein
LKNRSVAKLRNRAMGKENARLKSGSLPFRDGGPDFHFITTHCS